MSRPVRVIDNISNTVLFTTSIERISEAYSFATLMESEGLDIKIESPNLSETLIKSIGISENEHQATSDSCTFCQPSK